MIGENEDKLLKTVQAVNKNIKHLKEMVSKLEEKLDSKQPTPAEEKERIEKIFESKKIGRPVGSFEDKQKQYLRLLNKKNQDTEATNTRLLPDIQGWRQVYDERFKHMMLV